MIPEAIVDRMREQGDYVVRRDVLVAKRELLALGISEGSEAFCFFAEYVAAEIEDSECDVELLDPSSPTPQMSSATDFVRELYGVSNRFVCISSTEGEGFFLLDILEGGVYDVEIPIEDALNEGRVEPSWTSFFSFIEWFLPDPK